MADEPILLGLAGAVFLMEAETGGLIQSFQRDTTRKKILVYNASVGKTTGKVYHDPSATYNVRVIQTGTTGIPAASPGVALTLANTDEGNGVTGGGIFCESVSLSHTAENLREFTVTAEQHPAIAAPTP